MQRKSYKEFYDKQAEFYRRREWARKMLISINYLLTAAIGGIYLIFAAWTGYKFHSLPISAKFLGVPFLCFIAVSVLRVAINRPRPYEKEGIEPLIAKKKNGRSFPSRHLASAFVIGVVLLPYGMIAGIAVLAMGAIMGYIRFAAGLHYPSDLLFGAAMGTLFGLLILI